MVSDLLSSVARPSPSLVGRGAELDRLTRAIGLLPGPEDAVRHAVVAGEAGIGKTRLLAALAELVTGSGRRVAIGHCLDFGDASLPYLPFTEIFGQLQAQFPREMTAIAQRHRGIHRLLPAERRLPDDDAGNSGQVARTELFDAVARTFDRLAGGSPEGSSGGSQDGSGRDGLVIMIEDLHWSDPSSRDLLTYLLSRRFENPVSLVASYRSDDLVRTHPLRLALANWSRLEQVDRIDLPPLPESALQQLVAAIRPDLRADELTAVVTRAEGNAFFAEELAAAANPGGVLPADLAGLLLLRLDVLSDQARHVVRVASVAGRQVGHDLLARVADLPTAELDAAIRDAVEHQVLVGREHGYAFRHALLAEAVYDDLLPGERVRFHAKFVSALSEPGIGGTAAELARHARASHDQETALRASIEAGDEATRVGGPDDALRHYRNALQLAEQHPIISGPDVTGSEQTAALVQLTIKAADAAESAGHLDQAINLLRDRLAMCPADCDDCAAPAIRATLLEALAAALLYSDYDLDERDLLNDALDLIDPEVDRTLYARILATRARSFSVRARYPDAIEMAQQATAVAKELGLQRIVNEQTILLAKIKQRLGDPESSITETERVLASAIADGDATTELRATDQLGAIRFEQGQLAQALASFEAGAERAVRIGRRWSPYGLDSVVMAAQTAFALGDWDHCVELSAAGERVPDLARANLDLGILAVQAGRGQVEALSMLPRLRRWWAYDSMVTINCAPAIELYAVAGDHDAATGLYDDMVANLLAVYGNRFIGHLRLSGVLLGVLSSAAATGGDLDQLAARAEASRDTAREAMETFLQLRTPGPEAYAWQSRMEAEYLRFFQRIGRPRGSTGALVSAWEESVRLFLEYPHVYELARSRTRLAEALLLDDQDRKRAEELLAQAADVATRLGARPLLAEIADLRGRSDGRFGRTASSRASTSNPLTLREREVLDLVAEGLSNRDIGARLVISTKTASVHVSNIMAKLGAESRTEAVAIARRNGILT